MLDFKAGDIVYAESHHFDELNKRLVRIKNKEYKVFQIDLSGKIGAEDLMFVVLDDGQAWKTRKANYRKYKYKLTDFL